MNAKTQSAHLSNSKETNSFNILLFLNDLKYKYKTNQYWSNLNTLDSFFCILNRVATFTHKLSSSKQKNTLTEKQITQSKCLLQKEINTYLKSLSHNPLLTPQSKTSNQKSIYPNIQTNHNYYSNSNNNNNKFKPFEPPKSKREISNQNIIAKIKEKMKLQGLNSSMTEITQPNIEKKHRIPGIRSISQTLRNRQLDPEWKTAGSITCRNNNNNNNNGTGYSMNLSNGINAYRYKTGETLKEERPMSRDKIREVDSSYGNEYDEAYCNTERRIRSRGKMSRGESNDGNQSSDIRLSFYATRLVNQYQNVIQKYYTIKTEEEAKKNKTHSDSNESKKDNQSVKE